MDDIDARKNDGQLTYFEPLNDEKFALAGWNDAAASGMMPIRCWTLNWTRLCETRNHDEC